ncbi:MAG: DUF2341 domain-containing protein, partial [Nanoarchaeota archaeon]|nr:DUF2341 domain-containing protein [Nanoarchaeota archaeon]
MNQNKINVIIFIIIIVLMSGVCYAGSSDNGFTVGDTTLTYRTPVDITENSGSNLTDYQVLLTVDSSSLISEGKMQADCDDIRFTDSDGSTELSYWLESGCNTASTKVWVKVPSLAASSTRTLYMYYGNLSTTYNNSLGGNDTFDFFDDFSGSLLDTTKWTQHGSTGSVTVSAGELTISNTGTSLNNLGIYSKINHMFYGKVLETRSKNTQGRHSLVIGFAGSPYDPYPHGDSTTNGVSWYGRADAGSSAVSIASSTNTQYNEEGNIGTAYSDYKIEWLSDTSVKIYRNNVLAHEFTNPDTIHNSALPVYFSNDGWYSAAVISVVDNVRVRKYASSEPTYTIGSEQSSFIYSYCKAITIDNTGGDALTDYQIKIEDPVYNETGLVGSWHFDNSPADSSGNDNTGTLQGNTHYVEGRYGQAASFDGSGDYVSLNSPTGFSTGANDRTITAWIRPDAVVSMGVAGYGAAPVDQTFEIFLYDVAGVLTPAVHYAGGNSGGTETINTGEWSFLVATYDGTNTKLYVNNVLSVTQPKTLNTQTTYKRIGCQNYAATPSLFFNGLIDGVRIYNRALSDDEIEAHYDAKAKPNYGDIRFTDSTSFKESEWTASYPYWQEKDGTFWVKVQETPAGESKTIYSYYGNDEAESASDGTNTFEFFDDFSEDLSKWSVGTSTSIESGRLKLVDSSGQGFAESIQTLEGDLIAESDWWINQPTSNYDKLVFRFPINSEDQVYLMREYSAGQKAVWNAQGGGYNSIGFSENSGSWSISHSNNEQTAIINTYNWPQTGTFSSTIPFKIKFSTHHGHTGYIDNTRIRKYTSPEPT